jgi:hypothetical protein
MRWHWTYWFILAGVLIGIPVGLVIRFYAIEHADVPLWLAIAMFVSYLAGLSCLSKGVEQHWVWRRLRFFENVKRRR